jgi:hypothetical protein
MTSVANSTGVPATYHAVTPVATLGDKAADEEE